MKGMYSLLSSIFNVSKLKNWQIPICRTYKSQLSTISICTLVLVAIFSLSTCNIKSVVAQTSPIKVEATLQDAASSGNGTYINSTGMSLVLLAIQGSSGSDRVVTFSESQNGTSYQDVMCTNVKTLSKSTTLTTSGTTLYHFSCPVAGSKKFRTPISGGATGSITITATALPNVSGGGGESLQIAEADGTPAGFPSTLKFTNGAITDNGDGSFTVAVSGGSSGSAQVVYASSTMSLDSSLASGGGTDNTVAMQALFNLASTGTPVHIIVEGPILVGALNIYGNTTLECLAGGGFYLKTGTNRALLRNKNPLGSGAVTDKNITIKGCYFNGNSAGQTGTGTLSTQEANCTMIGILQLYGVADVKLLDTFFAHSKSLAVHVSNVTRMQVRNMGFDNKDTLDQQNGLQIEGPASLVDVEGLYGGTDDDMFAVIQDSDVWVNGSCTGLGPYVLHGATTDIVATNINCNAGCYSILRLFSNTSLADRIRVSNVTGIAQQVFSNLFNGSSGIGNIGTVELSGFNIAAPTTGKYTINALYELSGIFNNLVFTDQHIAVLASTYPIIQVDSDVVADAVTFRGLDITDTTTTGAIPFNLLGYVKHLTLEGVTYRRPTASTQVANFLVYGGSSARVDRLLLDDIMTTNVQYLVNQNAGGVAALGFMQAAHTRQESASGGATLRVNGAAVDGIVFSNWYADLAAPVTIASGSVARKRGDAFPADTTAPAYSSSEIGLASASIVEVIFSEAVNAPNFATGVTIKKNASTQTITAATRQSDQTKVRYTLSAAAINTDTMTWEYTGGTIADWSNNLLPTVTAQTVTNNVGAGGGGVSDTFTAANATALNGRTPSPTTAGFNWTTVNGSAGNQTIQSNAAQLIASGTTNEFLVVDSGLANATITAVVTHGTMAVSNGGGLIARYSGSGDYDLCFLGNNNTNLYKINGTVATLLQVIVAAHTAGVGYTMQMVVSGNTVTCTVNGAETVTGSDAGNAAATKHGILATVATGSITVAFDGFTVVP